MNSLCIKINNSDVIIYLLDRLNSLKIDSLYISNRNFKLYENVIIHYKGDYPDFFYDKIASILTDAILLFYEEKLLKRILEYNYFYFTPQEKKKILDFAKNFLDADTISKEDNYFSIYYPILDYVKENKALVLEGFVNFRLQNYIKNLDYVIDISVNKFLIEKEYSEFINILRLYVSMSPFNSPLVHLIYCNSESVLLDGNKNIIPMNENMNNAKYLSDITFSTNDYSLNTLLSLNPKKLIVHLIDKKEDEFINTLKNIFENRIQICAENKLDFARK